MHVDPSLRDAPPRFANSSNNEFAAGLVRRYLARLQK
jgi:hypothetical protein